MAGIGTLLVSSWVIFGVGRVRRMPVPWRARIWTGVVVLALCLWIAVRYGLPAVETRPGRFDPRWLIHRSVVYELEERFGKEEWTDRAEMMERVAAAVVEIVPREVQNSESYMRGWDMPRREDSPGNWELRWSSSESDEILEYVTIDWFRGEMAYPVVQRKK